MEGSDSGKDRSASSGQDSRPGLRRPADAVVPNTLIDGYFETHESRAPEEAKPAVASPGERPRKVLAAKKGRARTNKK